MARLKIVILTTIIALLLVTILLALGSGRLNANAKQRLSDIQLIQTAMTDYFQDHAAYPYGKGIPNDLASYLDRWPTPPQALGSCASAANRYIYTQQYGGDDYSVSFCLSAKAGGFKAGMHVLSSKGIQ